MSQNGPKMYRYKSNLGSPEMKNFETFLSEMT